MFVTVILISSAEKAYYAYYISKRGNMFEFLSEENVVKHKDYLQNLKYKYAVFEKSIQGVTDKRVREAARLKLGARDKSALLPLLAEITLHDIYFSSFTDRRNTELPSAIGGKSRTAQLLYELFETAMKLRVGFVGIYKHKDSLSVYADDDVKMLICDEPLLAIDASEHAYFIDYGFDKRQYLLNALSYLDLEKLK